jgi:hypothetical protein
MLLKVNYYSFMDNLDMLFEQKEIVLSNRIYVIFLKLKWYWDEFTLGAVLFLLLGICCGIAIILFYNRIRKLDQKIRKELDKDD